MDEREAKRQIAHLRGIITELEKDHAADNARWIAAIERITLTRAEWEDLQASRGNISLPLCERCLGTGHDRISPERGHSHS